MTFQFEKLLVYQNSVDFADADFQRRSNSSAVTVFWSINSVVLHYRSTWTSL